MTAPARPLKVALFGSPDFALPTLETLRREHELALVVTQSPKPAGRGLALREPAAALRAFELGIPVEQPTRLKGNTAFRDLLASLKLDVAVTAAYGRILPQALLDVPRHGFLNVHASLLPKYRGAAPVQRALINGETSTGVTIMQTEAGLDTGPIRLQAATEVGPDEGAVALLERLARLGAATLSEALALLAVGRLGSTPQDDANATHAPPLTVEDGRIRWSEPAAAIVARHRGVEPWPGSHFEHQSARVKVSDLRSAHEPPPPAGGSERPEADPSQPGTVVSVRGDSLVVATGDGSVELLAVKPAGGRAMSARAWANGRGVKRGTRLG